MRTTAKARKMMASVMCRVRLVGVAECVDGPGVVSALAEEGVTGVSLTDSERNSDSLQGGHQARGDRLKCSERGGMGREEKHGVKF